MNITWPSPGKINLFLYINKKRKDGYHNIQTILQFIQYGDKIKIKKRKDNKINIIKNIKKIPKNENLIIKAANLLQKYSEKKFNKKYGADIYIKKILPIGSGLGGGSSNAATTMIALNYIWKTNFSDNFLIKISNSLGADIPFFLNGNSSFAEGIGNKFIPINLENKWNLIIYPNISILTKKIFSDPKLKRNSKKIKLDVLLKKPFKNDCESIVRKKNKKINKLFNLFKKNKKINLTGTGSCVFIQYKTKKKAYEMLNKSPKWAYSFIAKSVNYSPLHKFRDSLIKKNKKKV